MLLSMGSQRVGHRLATEQQQISYDLKRIVSIINLLKTSIWKPNISVFYVAFYYFPITVP